MQRILCKGIYAKVTLHMTEDKPRLNLGPESLKAFAHPLRMAMYSALQAHGPATASGLARRLGESSGQTSYHLRQLERHGFVEDDPDHGGGRERWWRPVGFDMSSPDLLADPATEPAARAVLHQSVAERAGALNAWVEGLRGDPGSWAGLLATVTLELTQEEFEALAARVQEFVDGAAKPFRNRVVPEGARRVRIHADVFPLVGADES